MNENAWNILNKFKRRASLLWATALEKEFSIKEIAEKWNFKFHIPLYKDNLPQFLVDSGLWRITRIEKREAKYISIFDGYFDVIKYIKPPVVGGKEAELLSKDKEKFKEFFEDEKIRKSLFNIEAIKTLCKNDRELVQKIGFTIPVFSLSLFLINVFDSEKFDKIVSLFDLFYGIHPLGIPEYSKIAFSHITTNDLKKWEHLLDTNFGKCLIGRLKNERD